MSAQPAEKSEVTITKKPKKANELFKASASNEIVFAVVGHVGSGTTEVAKTLHDLLEEAKQGGFDAEILKARDVIAAWAQKTGKEIPVSDNKNLDVVTKFQNLGDLMREDEDFAAVARDLVINIRAMRAEKIGEDASGDKPIKPDGRPRAYILDSIRHPAEVLLLRRIYQEAFVLIGVVCDEPVRLARIVKKYENAGEVRAKAFMKRDARAVEKHGQRVSDAFHLSDFFVDNSADRKHADGSSNEDWLINEDLSRLVKIITHSDVVRPYSSESAMYHAFGAQMRSACMSRQVGAAIVDKSGNVVAVGSNEVPCAGGGVYGEVFDYEQTPNKDPNRKPTRDDRCVYRSAAGEKPYCSNTHMQNEIIDELIDNIAELKALGGERKALLKKELHENRIGSLLEFSRAVHAEMDALLSAARKGVSPKGARLFVTTFPCHYCARHIVSAGIDEVQFIEPYLKSQALALHHDSITTNSVKWEPPSVGGTHVLFRPFTGVAPRLYRRAFLKDRELKNEFTGDFEIATPEWGTPWHLSGTSYVQLEAELKKHV